MERERKLPPSAELRIIIEVTLKPTSQWQVTTCHFVNCQNFLSRLSESTAVLHFSICKYN